MTGRDWTEGAGLPKVRAAAKNLSAGTARLDQRRLTQADTARQARLAQHGGCVDHVRVEGLANRVCVLRGQDPALVAAEAAALVGRLLDLPTKGDR